MGRPMVNTNGATIRALLDCQCGQRITFYVGVALVSFLVKHEAPGNTMICTERCRNCRTVVAVTVKDVGWRTKVAQP
jgi:hypothetical protein